jgi:hypothetical protein
MKTISVETLIKTIRDNYDKYIEEGFDVPEVKVEHGNGFMKLETDDKDNMINSLLYIKKDEYGIEFTGRTTDSYGNVYNYNIVTTEDEITEIIDGLFMFFVGFHYDQFSNLKEEYYTGFKTGTGELFGKYKGMTFEI